MDDELMREANGGFAVMGGINRILCDCSQCANVARHVVTNDMDGLLLERHLCDEHFPLVMCRWSRLRRSQDA